MRLGCITGSVAIAIAALAASSANAENRVVDGDTIMLDGERVRLFGIDSPERGQPGAAEATAHLRRLVGQDRLSCEQVDYDGRNRRPVSLCSVRGADLSLTMVRAGHAVVCCSFVQKQRPALLRPFQAAESEARQAKRGIWARPMKAWRDWRC